LSDEELSKRLDLVRKQQNINGEQYFEALNKKEKTQKIEDSRKNLDNQERAIIEARLIKYDKKHKMAKGGEVYDSFTYMMLGRLKSDNEYYLGYGNRSDKNLWAGNVDGQIAEMKKLWNQLPKDGKPEWLTMEDIEKYEIEMKGNKMAKGGEIGNEEILSKEDVKKLYDRYKYLENLDEQRGGNTGFKNQYKNVINEIEDKYVKKIIENSKYQDLKNIYDKDLKFTRFSTNKKLGLSLITFSKYWMNSGGWKIEKLSDEEKNKAIKELKKLFPGIIIEKPIFNTTEYSYGVEKYEYINMIIDFDKYGYGGMMAKGGKVSKDEVEVGDSVYIVYYMDSDGEAYDTPIYADSEKEAITKFENDNPQKEVSYARKMNTRTEYDIFEEMREYKDGGETKQIIELTPIYTKRDKQGFRFYSTNDGNTLYAEKNGKIYNVSKDSLNVLSEVFFFKGKEKEFVGLINDEDVKNLYPLHYEYKTLGKVRKSFGMAKGGRVDKKIDVIVYGNKKLEYTNYYIDKLIEDKDNYIFTSDNLPKWLIAVRNKGNINFPKNKQQVLSLLNQISNTNENVLIDVDSDKPAYLNKIIIGNEQIMAKGGDIDFGHDLGDGFSIGNDVHIIDPKSLFINKTGYVSGLAGKDLLVTLIHNGNERNVVVSKKGVEKIHTPMANGGEVKVKETYKYIGDESLFTALRNGRNFVSIKKGDVVTVSKIRADGKEDAIVVNFDGDAILLTKDKLQDLTKFEKNTMANGGDVNSIDSLYYLQVIKDDKEVAREKFRAKNLKQAKEISEKEYESSYISKYGSPLNFIVSEAMAEGGKVTFQDKVKAIQKKLLANKKVPKAVQKDYGKTYNKDEAKESAQRIVGSMAKNKMAKCGKTSVSPLKDRIIGSKKNKPGSASSKKKAQTIELSKTIITALSDKAKEYNKKHSNKVSTNALKAVMRRGMGAFSSSHRPVMTRQGWGYARVNKFLLKKGGTKVKAAYVQDDDLLENGGELKKIMKVSDKPKFKRLIDLEERAKDSMYKPSNVNNFTKWNESVGVRFRNKWNKMVLELRGYNDSEGNKKDIKPEWIKFVEEQGLVEDYDFGDVLA
jgi:hypothetical protein